MDIDMLRSVITVLSLVCFLGIVVWAYSKKARAGFDEAARLPLEDDHDEAASGQHREARQLIEG